MLSLTREYVRGGMSQAEAELAAHRHFGSVVRLKEQGHDIQAARVVEDVVRDVRHMGRGLRRMRALPGVTSAAAVDSVAVIGMPRGGTVFHRLGTPELPLNERPYATIRVVAPGYFRTLRIPVRRGREFTESDDANPAAGFVVNEAFARTYLSGIDPLTVSISVWMEQENPHLPIIGVVGNVSEGSVKDKPVPTVFYSHRRMPETAMTLVSIPTLRSRESGRSRAHWPKASPVNGSALSSPAGSR